MRMIRHHLALVALVACAIASVGHAQTRSPVATEAFGGTMGNWTQTYPFWGSMTITSGVVHGSSTENVANAQSAVWSGSGTFSSDQYASMTASGLAWTGANLSIGVMCRSTTDTDGSRDNYHLIVIDDDSTNRTTYLVKVVNGTRTVLHSATVAWVDTDEIEIECEGTTIRGMRNGAALGGSFTQTDSALSSGKPGITGAGAAGGPSGDDWVGGDLTAGGGGGLRLRRRRN
jgi:hypothetical protein